MSLLESSVSEYTLYGKETGNQYTIVRHGIKGNKVSESKDTYNHWKVIENRIQRPRARYLINPEVTPKEEGWVSAIAADHDEFYRDKYFYFRTAEEAFERLVASVSEELTAE